MSSSCDLQKQPKGPRVLTTMVADLFHWGHLKFLKRLRTSFPNGYIIVGIHSDEEVAAYKRKPIIPMSKRIEMVQNCSLVNEVWSDTPLKLTKAYLESGKVDIVAGTLCRCGNEAHDTQYNDIMESHMFIHLPYTEGISTTDIIETCHQRVLETKC